MIKNFSAAQGHLSLILRREVQYLFYIIISIFLLLFLRLYLLGLTVSGGNWTLSSGYWMVKHDVLSADL